MAGVMLITGGSRGIGAATARLAAKRGFDVAVNYLKDRASADTVVASYNGGEDSVARWIKRARQHDPGVFTAEVGFDETKAYVNKVMANYRAYKQLYTTDLRRR